MAAPQDDDELSQSRLRYAAVVENLMDGITFFDDEGRYHDANPAAVRILGRTRRELLSMTVIEVGQQSPEELQEAFQRFRADGHIEGEMALRQGNGEVIIVEYRAVAQVLPGLHMAVLRDITEHVRTVEALRRSEARFRQFHQSNPLPAWAVSIDDGRIHAVNDSALALYGYSREQFARMRVQDLLRTPAAPSMPPSVATRYGPEPVRHRASGGRTIEVLVYGQAMEMDGRKLVFETMVDVTERRRLQRQSEALKARFQQVSRHVVRLEEEHRMHVGRELHDGIGQNLSALSIMLTCLQQRMQGASKGVIEEALTLVEEAGRQVRTVIAELRPEGLLEYGLVAALRDLAVRYRSRYPFDFDFRRADPQLRLPQQVEVVFYRICLEALSNVAKHAAATTVRITYRQRHCVATLALHDDGCGFIVREQARGMRWGLMMLRERADSVGSKLRVFSRPGAGTLVAVRWRKRRGAARAPR